MWLISLPQERNKNEMKQIVGIIFVMTLVIILSKYFIKSDKAEKYNSQGLIYLNESKYSDALIEFKKAYEVEEGNWQKKVMHLKNIILAYEGLNDTTLALKIKKEALKLCPKNTYDYFTTKGDIDLSESNIESAISNFKKAIKINPNKLEANNSLGLIYIGDYGYNFSDLEKALIYNHKALEVYPYSITKNVLGRNYFLLEEYKKADKYFSEILKDYPNDLDTNYSLGIIKYELNDIESAKKFLKYVVKLSPEYFDDNDEILKKLNIE